MEYLGYTVSVGKISVSTKQVEAVAEVPATEGYANVCLFGSL
jgi:hypothetical protein